MMKAKQINDKAPETVEELKYVQLWHAFNYNGQQLRVVPATVNGGEAQICRSCYFDRHRLRLGSTRCEGMCACFAHLRPDHTAVKFIAADVNCIMDERQREMAKIADLNNRW